MFAAAGDENSHDDNKEQENRRWPIQHKLTVRNDLTSRKYPPIFVRNHGSEKGGTQSNLGQMMPVHNTAEA